MSFAVVVSCMPGIRLFVLHFFPKLDSEAGSRGVPSAPSASNENSGRRGQYPGSKRRGQNMLNTDYVLENTSTYELLEENVQPKAFDPQARLT